MPLVATTTSGGSGSSRCGLDSDGISRCQLVFAKGGAAKLPFRFFELRFGILPTAYGDFFNGSNRDFRYTRPNESVFDWKFEA
jgi:hypothetical protein